MNKTIWGMIAVLSAFSPTVSLANPPEAAASVPINYGAVGQSALGTSAACQANIGSSNCLNATTQTLTTAGVQLSPGVSSAVQTAGNVASFDVQANLATLTSSCNDISNPMACVSGAKGILGAIGGLGIPGLDSITSSLTGMLTSGLADLAAQFPFLAGFLGQGGAAAPPTSQEIAKTNSDDIQKIAAASLALQAKATAEVLQQAQTTGEYTPGVANEIINRKSKAFAAAMTGTAALQANQQNSNAAAADVKTTNDIAATDYDSSLDALAGTNKSLAAVARGQERINAALIESKTTQGQLLEQTALVRDTINQANIRHDTAIQKNVETQTAMQCFQASIYRPKLTCK
jgi:hypothetical protein